MVSTSQSICQEILVLAPSADSPDQPKKDEEVEVEEDHGKGEVEATQVDEAGGFQEEEEKGHLSTFSRR